MTAIEYQNYMIDHGVEFRQAQAIATGLEKTLEANDTVTKSYLDLALLKQQVKVVVIVCGFNAALLYPLYQHIFNLPKFW